MNAQELQNRTKQFAIDIINLVKSLPNNRVGWTFTDQMVRSATSVAANYRAVNRAKSDKDFINKKAIVIEEADETSMINKLNTQEHDYKTHPLTPPRRGVG